MGVLSVNKLLITMALPMILSMLIQALYNIVDSVFLSYISENAFTAVSLAFPIQNIIIGINVGTGVGINAILSKSLGEKNYERANHIAGNSILLALIGYILVLIFGVTCSRAFFEMQTDVAEIVELGTQYISICCIFSFGVFFMITFEKLLQSTGRTMHSMFCQLFGAIINIILDPIMIFGYFGLPAMGVSGAAYATVIGQILGGVFAAILNIKLNHDIKFSFSTLKPNAAIIKQIYAVGFPSIIMNCIGSVTTYGLNRILIGFSTTATAVLGGYFKLQSFIFMPVFGLNNGMVPIIAYNFGARNRDRVVKTMKLGILYASCIMLIGVIVMTTIPHVLLGFFNPSDNMLAIGTVALRTISLSYIFAGFNIVCLSVCQSLGHGFSSMMVSFIRQIIVLLPAAFIMAKVVGLDGVWWAFPIAEVAALLLCIIFIKRIYTKEIKQLSQVDNAA